MRDGHRNRHTAHYADAELECFPREKAHPWLIQNRDCIGNLTAMRSYAAAVSGVDDGVGQILDSLAELGVASDTLIVYTADHGLCAGHHGFWGMSDHGRPLTMYDENLRVPLIFRHPGRIAPGTACQALTCNYDLFPSLQEHLGLPSQLGEDPPLPGRSFSPALAGEKPEWGEEITFHEYENARTVRTSEWKLTLRFPDGPCDLHHLKSDPGERHNLIDVPQYQGAARDLTARLDAFFCRYADPRYNLWRGGHSKAGRSIPELCGGPEQPAPR